MIQWFKDLFRGIPLGARRGSGWTEVRSNFLRLNPLCAVCLSKKVEVHHKIPFYLRRDLELDPDNLITLCRDHHFWFGHLGDWKAYNIEVSQDAATWQQKIKGRKYN